MLSRVADSLYWLGRYSERVYTNAYIAGAQIDQMLELGRTDGQYEQQWECVLSIGGYKDDYQERYSRYEEEDMLFYLLSDRQNYNSIERLLESIRDNAKNTRDCIPNALFEQWNSLYLNNQENPLQAPYNVLNATELLSTVQTTSLTATGIIDSLMTRDECFLFVKIGKWLERSEKTALILLTLMENASVLNRDFAVTYALQLTNTLDEYTRRSRHREADLVLKFLIQDAHCSRSVSYGVRKIKKTIFEIEKNKIYSYATDLFKAIEKLEQAMEQDPTPMSREARMEWIRDIHKQCIDLGPIFSQTYYLTEPILVK